MDLKNVKSWQIVLMGLFVQVLMTLSKGLTLATLLVGIVFTVLFYFDKRQRLILENTVTGAFFAFFSQNPILGVTIVITGILSKTAVIDEIKSRSLKKEMDAPTQEALAKKEGTTKKEPAEYDTEKIFVLKSWHLASVSTLLVVLSILYMMMAMAESHQDEAFFGFIFIGLASLPLITSLITMLFLKSENQETKKVGAVLGLFFGFGVVYVGAAWLGSDTPTSLVIWALPMIISSIYYFWKKK